MAQLGLGSYSPSLTLCDPMDYSPSDHPSPGVCPSSCPLHWWCNPDSVTPCHTLLFLHSIFPSISVFSNELAVHIRWPKNWSFNFSISPFNEYSGLISFQINWFDRLTVHGTLKSLLQHHHLKASIPQCFAFFTVQLSQLYMTTGKNMALTLPMLCSVMSKSLWPPGL